MGIFTEGVADLKLSIADVGGDLGDDDVNYS